MHIPDCRIYARDLVDVIDGFARQREVVHGLNMLAYGPNARDNL